MLNTTKPQASTNEIVTYQHSLENSKRNREVWNNYEINKQLSNFKRHSSDFPESSDTLR